MVEILITSIIVQNSIYHLLLQRVSQHQKSWAMLIDPDKTTLQQLFTIIEYAQKYPPTLFFVGSSLLMHPENLNLLVQELKKHLNIPIILFPGSYHHLSVSADAVLFLSLISGRNPDFLIGNHLLAAPLLKKMHLEVIPTGYMLIDGGRITSVAYISNTQPLPNDKADLAVCTAMAGELLGMKLIYLEAGSGALTPVPPAMIRAVKENIQIPLIVGGGIRTTTDFQAALQAGADVIVTGNVLEKNIDLMKEFFQLIA